ncbi:Uncharacterized protein Fot_11888 [Forsythia ovata]|uniref:Uncharacterized protein n=1 Tax=Forsythia ovata TaxID=205694 RepID=A0ABD1WNP4_9LAMI
MGETVHFVEREKQGSCSPLSAMQLGFSDKWIISKSGGTWSFFKSCLFPPTTPSFYHHFLPLPLLKPKMDLLDMSFIGESFDGNVRWRSKDDDQFETKSKTDNLEAASADD